MWAYVGPMEFYSSLFIHLFMLEQFVEKLTFGTVSCDIIVWYVTLNTLK